MDLAGTALRRPLPSLSYVLLIPLLWLTTSLAADSPGREARPNILLIVTDDQGWGDLSSHGNPYVQTPVLDGLRRAGATLERFFVQPVCAPTRAELLTGRYYLRTGVHGVTRGYERMRASEVTLAEVLQAHGYATGCFGKWHNGAQYPHHPNGQGFDEFVGFCGGHLNNYFSPLLEHNGVLIRADGYVADALTDHAIAFIRQNRDRPFFCYLPYNTPHSPFQVPDRFFGRYRQLGLDPTLATIYAMCANLDANIGRLLQTLRDLGLERRTLVIFLSDNGPNTRRYNGGMLGRKGSVDEGGVRVPCFMAWPGVIRPGTIVRRIASAIDVMPTVLDFAGIDPPAGVRLDGLSLRPLLEGTARHWPDRFLFQHWSGARVRPDRGAVRTERYRAVFRRGRWQLYDLVQDPSQTIDLAETKPDLLRRLREAYREWFHDVTTKGFDPIPVHLGHPGWDTVHLPAHEATLEPAGRGIRYVMRQGWANDWIAEWTDTNAYAWWPVRVVRGGTYEFALQYACSADDVGAKLAVRVGEKEITARLTRPFEARRVPSPDRVPRREVYERVWGQWTVGQLRLEPGTYRLELRALHIPGRSVGEIKAVIVRRVELP